jgi:eyes absent family protein 4
VTTFVFILILYSKRITNLVITSGQLIPTLAKLIIFRLAEYIPIENVYSTRSLGKRACINKIREKHNNKLLVIAYDKEDEQFCKEVSTT